MDWVNLQIDVTVAPRSYKTKREIFTLEKTLILFDDYWTIVHMNSQHGQMLQYSISTHRPCMIWRSCSSC